jgi:uroporphyrinogen-III synthase
VTAPKGVPVAIATAAGTLTDLEESLRRRGHPVVRFDASRFVPTLSAAELRRLRDDPWDGILVSSPRGLELFLEPVYRSAPKGTRRPVAYVAGEFLAAGAARLGFVVVRPSGPPSLDAIVASVPSARPLRLLHPRSDVAGPALARRLRAKGHTVRDVVAIRTVRATRMPANVRSGFRTAGLLVVSTPPTLAAVRRHLGPEAFRELAATVPFRVLGGATERAARRAGVRDVARLDPGPGQRFTPATVDSLFDGRAAPS